MSSSRLKKNVKNIHRSILEKKIIAQEKENIKIKIEERKQKKLLEQRKYIDSLKIDWRKELSSIEEFEESVKISEQSNKKCKIPSKLKSNWREEIQKIDENLYNKQELESSPIDEDLFEVKPFIKNKIIKPEVYERWYQTSNWRDEFIEEGMSTKDFAYLYGLSIYDLQINSVLGLTQTQNTQAQDIVQASADATDYAFGPEFPGSYVNTIGDPVTSELSTGDQPQSLSKVDAQARISPGDTDSETKKDWGGDQDGAVLPSDPWNYNPTPIVADGDDYEQVIRLTVNSNDPTQIKVYSINLSAGQTYNFKTLDFTGPEYSDTIPGFNNSFNSDSVLTLQDVNGNVVAQNDDLFPGTYNQYVASNPGDTYPEGPGGEPEFYSGFGWTASPINYNTTEVPGDESQWYYILNSNISYTPTQSGTYYLAIRDYFDIGPSGATPTAMHYKLVVRGAAPADSQGGPPTEKPGGSTQDTTAAWNLGGPVSAFLANPESKDRLKSKTLELSDFKSAADFDAFKAGGGNAALKQGKTLAQVIAQGKINLGDKESGLGVLGGAATAAGALVGNFSTKDLTSRLSSRLPGYTIGKFENTGKGDHYTAPVLDSKGKPVIDQQTGKPIRIGGGIRGKDQWSNSAMGTLTNAINTIKRQLTPTVQTQPAKVTVTSTKTEKGTPTRTGTRSASRVQPTPTERSTIKSMPANMMGRRGGGGGSGSSMIQPVDPFDYPTDPLSGYTWDKKSGRYLANSYTPYVNRIKGLIRENKKMKLFKQFVDPSNYEGKPSPNGFPENPPPKMINGYHPEYGKRSRMYNTLDKISATSMPLTGDPETDQKIIKARQQPK